MAQEHVDIADPEIHEPKNVSTAESNHVYLADGAGSGAWDHAVVQGGMYYNNIGTGTTITTPTAYTLIGPATTVTSVHDFSHNSLGRLTYTGTANRHGFLIASLSVKHSTGTGQDVYFAVHKNGTKETSAEMVRTADSANYGAITLCWDGTMSTNDYFEIYTKVATGSVVVHSFTMNVHAVRE